MDLGRKMNELPGTEAAPKSDKEEEKVYYPSFYLSNAPPEIEDIPDEGTATIRYKVTSKTVREEPGKEKRHVDVNIDVISFDPEERPRPRPSRTSPRDAVHRSLMDFMLSRHERTE